MVTVEAEKNAFPQWPVYLLIAVAGFVPISVGFITGDYELVKRLAETPVVAALATFLVKVVLDANAKAQAQAEKRHHEDLAEQQRRHDEERERMSQQLEHAFTLGSSSHMANVAFDKHVKFCEDYAEELRNTLAGLLDHKRRREAYDQSTKLTALRRTQALWLTPQMEEPLEKIERALRWIGAGHMIADDPGAPEAERNEVREKVSKLFIEVLGEELGREPEDDELAISKVVRWLGRILGVDDLTRLRQKILSNAATSTAKT